MVKNYTVIAFHKWLRDFRQLSLIIYREAHPELDLIPISQSKIEFELHKQYVKFTKHTDEFNELYEKHKEKIQRLR